METAVRFLMVISHGNIPGLDWIEPSYVERKIL